MSYTPNSVAIFLAAYNGALSGMQSGRWPTNPTAANYLLSTQVAGGFAQELDTVLALTAPDTLQVSLAESLSQAAFTTRQTANITPSVYSEIANGIKAQLAESETYFAGQGISPGSDVTNSSNRARGVVTANVADLTQFDTQDPTNNDGIAVYLEGQIAFLAAQTDSFTMGPWVVGTPDGITHLAALTRPSWFAAGSTQPSGVECRIGGEGGVYQNSVWATMMANNTLVVDAGAFQWFPRVITGTAGLTNGISAAIHSMPTLNGSSQILVTRTTPVATALSVEYVVQAGSRVDGPLGSAEFFIIATKADATTNAADQSTVGFTVINQA